jgi:hypothetical protein
VPEPVRGVCVLLVDGLGFHLVRDEVRRDSSTLPTLGRLLETCTVLEVGFPSSTPISLMTLGVGVPAGIHGMVGLHVRDPDRARLVMPFGWRDDDPPAEAWQPRPTVCERVVAAGGAAVEVGPGEFDGVAFTQMAFRGAQFVSAESRRDLVAGVGSALGTPTPTLVYAYTGELDHAGHVSGLSSSAWRDELVAVDTLIGEVERSLLPGCILLVTGDHGMVDAVPDLRVDLDTETALAVGLDLVGGEPRARHLYCRPELVPEVVARFTSRFDGRAIVRRRQEAIDEGWFGGEPTPELGARIGDVVVAAFDGGTTIVRSRHEPELSSMIGVHGGMHERESQVPLLVTAGRSA